MALLPVLLDMVDEIYDNLDNPSKTSFADIPLLFLPQRGEQQQQPTGGCPRRSGRRGCRRGEASAATKGECPCPFKQEQVKEDQQAVPSECPKSKCPKSDKCQQRPTECPREKTEGEKQWNTLAFYDHPWARRHFGHGRPPFDHSRQPFNRPPFDHHGRPPFERPGFDHSRPPFEHPGFDWMRHCHQKRCAAAKTSNDFELALDVKSFKPEEITVKVKGREIFIEGKHEEREDEHGFVTRQFTRRYTLPDEFDIDTVTSQLNSNGKMIIKANKPKPVGEPGERIIPIERIASTSSDEESDKVGESSTQAADKEKEASPAPFELIDDEKPE